MVVPLQLTDKGTADACYCVWQETMETEVLDDVTAVSEDTTTYFSMDRDASNIKSDRQWATDTPDENHHRDGCYCHCLFTVSGGAFNSVPGLISGLVALDMATRSGCSYKTFRDVLVDVIFASVMPVDADPPVGGGDYFEFLLPVLDTFLSDPASYKQRQDLEKLIRSDIRLEHIIFYKRGGATPEEIWQFSKDLATGILPRRIGTLRRQRWLTTTRPLKETGLLGCCFHLLDRVLFHFFRRMRGMAQLSMAPRVHVVLDDALSDGEDEQPERGPPVNADGSPNWAAWNKSQQRTVERFRRSKPSGGLTVVALSMDPICVLAQWVVHVHSEAYDLEQRSEHAKGKQHTTIGMAMLKGEGFATFKTSIRRLMHSEAPWAAVPQELRTFKLRALASGTLARTMAGVEQLVVADSQRAPHCLDELLLDPTTETATRILKVEECRWTKLFEKFISKHNTPKKLLDRDSVLKLWIVSYMQRRAAILLESRMALLRSIAVQRGQTWKKSFQDVNTEWMILQARTLEADSMPPLDHAPKTTRDPRRRRDGEKRGSSQAAEDCYALGLAISCASCGKKGQSSKAESERPKSKKRR